MSFYVVKASIKPRAIHIFCQDMEPRNYSGDYSQQFKGATPYTGAASKASKARLLSSIDYLLYTAKYKTVHVKKTQTKFRYKVNFITLTLPSIQEHTDKEIIKTVFTPFMEAWQKRRIGLLYVWKAEVQDNGNLHFHVISNSFYHYLKLRRDWNRAVNKLGYCDRSSSPDPNSTDVHAIAGKKDLGMYLASYMSKKDIYKKPLKRYHKMYDKRHLRTKDTSCKLPKNYFSMIKRSLNCRTWSASAVLKGIKTIVDQDDKQHAWRMVKYMEDNKLVYISDFCHTIPLEVGGFQYFPEFKKAVDSQLEKLLKIQRENVMFEEIEEL